METWVEQFQILDALIGLADDNLQKFEVLCAIRRYLTHYHPPMSSDLYSDTPVYLWSVDMIKSNSRELRLAARYVFI